MLTISIQAGGQSSRMGQDKALIPFLGRPLIEHVMNRVRHLSDEIFITTNQPENYKFLNIPLHPDIKLGQGALRGLYTALKVARHPLVAVIACDMPFVNSALLFACAKILQDPTIDAVIPSTEFGLEPLHAVYRRERCLPPIEQALDNGKRRMIAWHGDANIQILSPKETSLFDPDNITFWNVNTPEDFKQAENLAADKL